MMKNYSFTSRATDLKVLGAVTVLGLSAVAGCLLPAPILINVSHMVFYDALITIPIWVFVWSVFHLVAPANPYSRNSHKWQVAMLAAIPTAWALLVAALGYLFLYMQNEDDRILEYLQALCRPIA